MAENEIINTQSEAQESSPALEQNTNVGQGLSKVLNDINVMALHLAMKRTWIRKGLKELIEKVNRELSKVEDGGIHAYYDVVCGIDDEEYIDISWRFKNGKISLMYYDKAAQQWTREVDLDEESPVYLRKAVEKFKFFIEMIIKKYKAVMNDYDSAIEILNKYLSS